MLDAIHAVLTILTKVLNLGLKNKYNDDLIKNQDHLIFNVRKQTFSQELTFKTHEFIGSLTIFNERPKETLAVAYHIEKKEKRKKLSDFKYIVNIMYI